ncbi:MAG: single-stranded DNA-binding protein [Bdellovibrionales bacterium]|nr:single-stranded DNA-binding protein [Bdellovibrionales bacterium]
MSINRVFLSGRLGQTPELRTTDQGKAYTILKIATNRYYSSEDQQLEAKTDWHDVFVWGKQGENCHRYLSRGQAVSIEGFLKSYKSIENERENYQKTIIQALHVDFLSSKPDTQNLTSKIKS